ncbi:hypothetical protein KGQ29_03045 [Patescibacteria group bacterium]|nr:hypothetical protein [Patescibacteria group bacterium]
MPMVAEFEELEEILVKGPDDDSGGDDGGEDNDPPDSDKYDEESYP